MTGTLGRMLRQGGIYALGNALIKLSGLILSPLYLDEQYLPPGGLGHLGALEATAQLTLALIGSGLTTGMLTFMSDDRLGEDRPNVPFTAYAANAVAAAFTVILFWMAAAPMAGLLLDDRSLAFPVRLLGVYTALKMLGQVPFMWMRGNERAEWYVAAALAEMAVLIGGVYYTLAVAGMGLDGILWAYVFSAAVSSVVLSGAMLTRTRWKVRLQLIRRLVQYGAPLTLVGAALPFLHTGDRILLLQLAGKIEADIYVWAARMAGVLNMLVVQSLQLAFAVIGLKALGGSGEGISFHRRTFRHYCIWAAWAVLGLSLFAYDATLVLSDNLIFLRASEQVFPLSLGIFFYGLYTVVANVLYAAGHTRTIGICVLGAALLNAALNFILIPPFGGFGAALATLLAYAVLMMYTARLAERIGQVRFSWYVLWSACLAASVLWGLALISDEWNVLGRLGFRVLLLLSYPLIVLLLRLYTRDELALGRTWIMQRLSREDRRPGS